MKRTAAVFLIGSLLALVLVVSAVPAFGQANPQSSCLGIGGSTETALGGPGERADISHEFIQDAQDAGSTAGASFSVFAQEHLGSIDACFG
jgi:hypothetical protein